MLTTYYPTYKLNLDGWVKMSGYDANKGIYDSDKQLFIVLNNNSIDLFENIEVKITIKDYIIIQLIYLKIETNKNIYRINLRFL